MELFDPEQSMFYQMFGDALERAGAWLADGTYRSLLIEGWSLADAAVDTFPAAVQEALGATPANRYLVGRMLDGARQQHPEFFYTEGKDEPDGSNDSDHKDGSD